jgi:hypothetical protein
VLVACSPAIDVCAEAHAHVTECGATYEPATCDECDARCYLDANCLEVGGRLNWPQPGELDGKIYSELDVCLASCGDDGAVP